MMNLVSKSNRKNEMKGKKLGAPPKVVVCRKHCLGLPEAKC